MEFVTLVSYEDENGNVDDREVITELSAAQAARAQEIYALVGGYMSHAEIVAAAMAASPE